jgi:hypothetical protein
MEDGMKKFALILVLCLVTGGLASAQPQISGPQQGTLGPGSYVVVGDIQVQLGATLTIAPGTTFLHNGNWVWSIYGRLTAVGTAADSIKFTRQQPNETSKWYGIRFESGAWVGCTLSYCVVEWCRHNSGSSNGAGIYSNGVPVTISHSRIANCWNMVDGAGIYINNAAATISYCLITDNTASNSTSGGAVTLNGCNGATVSYNVMTRNVSTGT